MGLGKGHTHRHVNTQITFLFMEFLAEVCLWEGESTDSLCLLTCTHPGETPRCDMGEVRRVLQQEEHHNV